MTEKQHAPPQDDDPDTDTQEEERGLLVDGRPVDRGPGQHHANADTTHSPTQQSRITHEF